MLIRDGGVIRPEFDAELDRLRGFAAESDAFLEALEKREQTRTGISTLKVGYNKVQGFFIEVSKAQSGSVPDDYTRRQTLKNAERYITSELKAYENEALSAQSKALQLEKQIWQKVLQQCLPYLPDLKTTIDAIAAVDVLTNHAERAETLA